MQAEVAKHERGVRVARGVIESNTTLSSSGIIERFYTRNNGNK